MNGTILQTETTDGYHLHYRAWQEGPSDLLVVMQHGILTHSGWFAGLADGLAARGIHAIGVDRRGSGLNEQGRGDVDGPQRLLDDVEAVVAPQRERYRTIVHYGWCLGSVLALRYLLDRPWMGEGLVMVSPDVYERHLRPAVLKTFASPQWDDRVLPRLKVPVPPEVYTDGEYLDSFVRPDPLRLKDFTPRFLRATVRLKEDLVGAFRAFDKPSLLVLAARDQIVDNERTRRLYTEIGSPGPAVVTLDTQHGIQFEALAELVAAVADFALGVTRRKAA